MSVKRLVEHFSDSEKCVVKLKDISEKVIQFGHVEQIDFVSFDEDPRDLYGMLVRWDFLHVYGETTSHAAVCFNGNTPAWMQRLICCKEMILIFEKGNTETKSRLEVSHLLDALFLSGQVVTDIFDAQSFFDHVAVYQALAILFPEKHRTRIEGQLSGKIITKAQAATELDVEEYFLDQLFSAPFKAAMSLSVADFDMNIMLAKSD